MLPAAVGNVVFIPPQQAPLTNTAILGSNVTRVPADNVPPSVSNAQVDNNTKGNNGSFAAASAAVAAQAESDAAFALQPGTPATPSVNLPTSFLAQLLGQDISPDAGSPTGSILLAYERLIALSNVKYKPSNALKPSAGPAGVFGDILNQSQQAPAAQAAPVVTADAVRPAAQDETPVVEIEIIEAQEVASFDIATASEPAPAPEENNSIILPGVFAYIATGVRNGGIDKATPAEASVSDLA